MPIKTSVSVTDHPPTEFTGLDALAVPFGTHEEIPALAGLLPLPWETLRAHYEVEGDAGEIVDLPVASGDGVLRVLFYGVGDAGPEAMRKTGATLARRAKGRGSLGVVLPAGLTEESGTAFATAALLASYRYALTTGDQGRNGPVGEITLFGGAVDLRKAKALADATALARDLTNTPASVKSPEWLAERAVETARDSGLTARVRSGEELAEFGGVRAVGMGSARPPRFIELSYTPEGTPERHVVLVGKGITFDSGGLSLKPTEGMKTMKTDMAGGAAIIAVMGGLAELGVRAKVTGLIAVAENLPSGSALRPGDVIVHYGGRTVEVLNTDAEGRLVLADALAYADERLAPDVVVDMATLTGAARVALGGRYAALYANDDGLAAELAAAAETSGDRVWRMPLVEDYLPALDSSVADLTNVEAGSAYSGGSITAALFLREFAGKRAWAHLDIAGPARSAADEGENAKGATGYGTRLLLEWLISPS
ncbi:leucyl aminopeptidase family protein [Rhizohabitans arisaemae]|uniref:leucyl aminopeptidase family protein n=1 Tax=Rhizohabitans arisaemae TaxID=2720610 RepID=UPI0024B04623|nr:leucyl aminopeptidase family protein [Rhizohabitans arisaemae]